MQKLHTFYFLKHMDVHSKHKHQGPVGEIREGEGRGDEGGGEGGGVVKPPAVRDPLVQ